MFNEFAKKEYFLNIIKQSTEIQKQPFSIIKLQLC